MHASVLVKAYLSIAVFLLLFTVLGLITPAVALDDDIESEYYDEEEESAVVNKNNNGGSLAAALAGLTDLFASGAIPGCEQELIPPEESCCHAPGTLDSPDAPHECFAPPMPEEDHPWDSSPALKEALKNAATSLSVEEFINVVGFSSGSNTPAAGISSLHAVVGEPKASKNNKISDTEAAIALGSTIASDRDASLLNNNNKVLIIDTRCASEFVAGHVPNSVFGGSGTDQFDRFIGTVHSDHNIPVVFITPTSMSLASSTTSSNKNEKEEGKTSDAEEDAAISTQHSKLIEEMAQRLVKAGLSNLKGHLKGGMASWVAQNKPIATVDRWNASTLARKLVESHESGASLAAFRKSVPAADYENTHHHHHPRQSLVDLREPCAVDFGTLPNAESIPVSETVLQEVYHRAQHEKDPNHPLVLFCSNGFRSLMVATALKAMSPSLNVVCMDMGFDELVEKEEVKAAMEKLISNNRKK